MQLPGFSFFRKRKDYGVIFLRLAFGFQLVHGTMDNVASYDRMLEFRNFLDERNVPLSLFAAHLSVYAQFICGLLLVIGLWTRPVSIVIVINFIAALLIVHVGLPYEANFPAINLLAAGLFFLFYGAGSASADKLIEDMRKRSLMPGSDIERKETKNPSDIGRV